MVLLRRQIDLTNPRLNVLYWIVSASTLALLCVAAYFLKLVFYAVPMKDRIDFSIWAHGNQPFFHEKIKKGFKKARNLPVCKKPEHYAFWWDKNGTWSYTMQGCIDLCDSGVGQPNCISMHELIEQPNKNEVVFVTEVDDEILARTHQNYTQIKSMFVAYDLKDLSIALTYGFKLPDGSWLPATVAADDNYFKYSVHDNILTVLLDADRKIMEVRDPQEDVWLTVENLLKMAGALDRLDMPPSSGAVQNYYGSAKFDTGPIARLSGLDLRLNLECFQDDHELPAGRSGWAGPVCYISVETSTSASWVTSKHVESFGTDARRHRNAHGIRVTVVPGGIWYFPSLVNLLATVISAFVLMRFPAYFVSLVACYCLGHLSVILRKAIRQRFNFMDACAGVTARLMSHALHYEQLEDPTLGGISKREVHKLVSEAMANHRETLDDREVENIVDFCFEAMLRGSPPMPSFFRTLNRVFCDKHKMMVTDSTTVVDIDQYKAACSTTELINVHDLIKVFDPSRHAPCLESFFMPPSVRFFRQQKSRSREYAIDGEDAPVASKWDETTQAIAALNERIHNLEFDLQKRSAHTPPPRVSTRSVKSIASRMQMRASTTHDSSKSTPSSPYAAPPEEIGTESHTSSPLGARISKGTVTKRDDSSEGGTSRRHSEACPDGQIEQLNLVLDRVKNLAPELMSSDAHGKRSHAPSMHNVSVSEAQLEHMRGEFHTPIENLRTECSDLKNHIEMLLQSAEANDAAVDTLDRQSTDFKEVISKFDTRISAVEKFVWPWSSDRPTLAAAPSIGGPSSSSLAMRGKEMPDGGVLARIPGNGPESRDEASFTISKFKRKLIESHGRA